MARTVQGEGEKRASQLLTGFIQERLILNWACGKLIYGMQQCIVRASREVLPI